MAFVDWVTGFQTHSVLMVFMMEEMTAEGLILSLDWTHCLKSSWV